MSRADVMNVLRKEFIDDNPDREIFPYLDNLIQEIIGRHYQSMAQAIGALKVAAYRVKAATEEQPQKGDE